MIDLQIALTQDHMATRMADAASYRRAAAVRPAGSRRLRAPIRLVLRSRRSPSPAQTSPASP